MKIIAPPNITLPNGIIASFAQFIQNDILSDVQFGRDFEHLQVAYRIHNAVAQPKLVDSPFTIELTDSDHQLLKSVMMKPTNGYQPTMAIHLMPFFQAVINT